MTGIKKILSLLALSVVLLSVAWLGSTGLTLLVALVPLFYVRSMMAEAKISRKWLLLAVASTFALWNALTIWWVSGASLLGAVAAVIIGTFLSTVVFMWYDRIATRASKLFAYTFFIVAWICAEDLYMNGELAFPWLLLGNGFANSTWAVQWYEITGAYGGTLWVLLSNIFLFEALSAKRNRALWATTAAVIFIPIISSLIIWATYEEPKEQMATVHVIQPNLDPYTEKFSMLQSSQTDLILELAAEAPSDVDFIVTPETAFDDRLWEGSIAKSSSIVSISELLESNYPQAKFIAGATTYRSYKGVEPSATARYSSRSDLYYDVYNSAIVVDSLQRMEVHHKSKLVAGVEKIPFYSLLKDVEFVSVELGGIAGQLGFDTSQKVFDSEAGDFSVAICYESIYGEYFSRFAARGAELMFVITNDGWWGNTAGHRQHFSFSRLRAIESRRAVVRSANTGISGVISPRGDIIESLGWDKRGTITASVPMNSKVTIYSNIGDATVRIAKLLFILMLLIMALETIKRKTIKRQS